MQETRPSRRRFFYCVCPTESWAQVSLLPYMARSQMTSPPCETTLVEMN